MIPTDGGADEIASVDNLYLSRYLKSRNDARGVYMENHDIIFEKIHNKEKEWKAQVEYLQSKIINYDLDRRIKIENLIDMLNLKLKEIENRTQELKQISSNLHQDVGEKLIYSWVELFTEIDNAMINLKNKLG